ncbi:hypothetical protein F5050DRAFT_1561665 [Lentinula boryana]|uniref:F-box domain-containing protein n=1 Tax=Lentinula boryana TaxID=40481 RepID=A0ABQ8QRL1_9AGAR|nr:hypothetical protein F5050DRAFT_1561665 [Lentinula boryana]
MPSFLSLPVELRISIYSLYLLDLQHVSGNLQPRNTHFRLLHVCRQISYEAGRLANFRSYVSLIHEDQISAFNSITTVEAASRILHADVANDSRLVHASGHVRQNLSVPASELYLVLSKLVSLRRLRVFECHRSRPMKDFIVGARFTLQFEKAMFPSGSPPQLDSYELYLSPFKSPSRIFQVVSPNRVKNLRLSGECGLLLGTKLPSLTNLAICGVTGHHLDQHMEEYFAQSLLEEVRYRQGDKLGARFELRDHQLKSLVFGSASGLHKLVLLDCTRLSSSILTTCFRHLEQLQYLALSFVSVHELDSNFVAAFPTSLAVVKLGITNAWFSSPLLQEEHKLCESFEESIIMRDPPLRSVHADLRDEVIVASSRGTRWTKIAKERKFALKLGPWEEDEIF